jgi:hypothetical protein
MFASHVLIAKLARSSIFSVVPVLIRFLLLRFFVPTPATLRVAMRAGLLRLFLQVAALQAVIFLVTRFCLSQSSAQSGQFDEGGWGNLMTGALKPQSKILHVMFSQLMAFC